MKLGTLCYVFLYTVSEFSGELKACDEGELTWVANDCLDELPMHEGDRHFLHWLQEHDGMISAKYGYQNGVLKEYKWAVHT